MTTIEDRVSEIERLSQKLSDHVVVTTDDLEFVRQWQSFGNWTDWSRLTKDLKRGTL